MLADNRTSGLNSLFPDLTIADFVAAHLMPGVPYHHHGPLERIALSEDVTEENLHSLFSTHKPISGVFHDRDGLIRYAHEMNETAGAAFEAGATILFQRGEPFVKRLAGDLLSDLGFPRSLLACSAFLTLEGGGSPWHCDTSDNFVIQVLGEKRWSLAPNREGHRAVENIWPMVYGNLATPPEITEQQNITLRPGSVLFLPRNHWHKTQAIVGPSFAVTVGVNRPTYLALMLAVLHEHFGDDADMLDATGPLLASHGRESATVEGLARRMKRLESRLGSVDLAAATRHVVHRAPMRVLYRVAEDISQEWHTDSSGEQVLTVRKGEEHLIELAFEDDADLGALVPVILQQTEPFSVRSLLEGPCASLGIDAGTLSGTLRQLVLARVLRCHSADRGREYRDISEFV